MYALTSITAFASDRSADCVTESAFVELTAADGSYVAAKPVPLGTPTHAEIYALLSRERFRLAEKVALAAPRPQARAVATEDRR